MRVISSTLGSLTNDPFKITVLAANTYIPIYAFHTYYQEEGVKFYQRPCLEKGAIRKPNTLKHIKDALEMAIAPRRITIGDKFYYFLKGAMYTEEGIPLMVLGMSRQAYEDPDIKNFSEVRYGSEVNPVDYKNFVMFYSTSFFTDPNLAPLNRRFQKELMMSCYKKGIEVRVITSSEIERNTFANIFEIPKVNSVDQLEEYMNKVLPTFLYVEEEDTFAFEELRAPEIVQDHELSVEEEALLFDSEDQELPELELIPYEPDEYQVEREEMEREAATWDSAHTESPYLIGMDPISDEVTITERRPHPVDSLVERLRSSQHAYNMQMHTFNNLVITGESVVHADYAIANALAVMAEDVTWRSSRTVGTRGEARDSRPIELIDDTE
jgi:hypothetical protein